MIDLDLLKKLGVTQEALKKTFSKEHQPEGKIKTFIARVGDRIQEAIDSNLTSWQLYYAIDRAVDTSMYATSRTMFQGLVDGRVASKDVLSMVNDFGLNKWMRTACGCGQNCTNVGTCQTPQKIVDIPAFFEVTFPIALAMKTIRVARIFNDRNLYPQFKYEPLTSTAEHRMKCEIITSRVQVQSQQMEYRSVLKQVINQTLAYSHCLLFPKEAWWADSQPTDQVEEKDGKRVRKAKTVREGIRYEHPHPSRMYYDLAHPAYTLNSNTGCQYAGYWGLVRFGVVKDNPDYWNTDKITYGKDSFRITESNRTFFRTVMPCTMSFPTFDLNAVGQQPIGGTIDAQERMQEYTTNDSDSAVLLTNHFERLNPKRDLGLKNEDGDGYDGEVWFRFVVASDDTIVYAEPLAYTPTLACLYDPDANKARVTSLVQECIPTQDMVGNLLTQAILQAKNNLRNINFFNTDVLDDPVVKAIENVGEKSYREPIMIPFSLHESTRLDNDRRDAIIPVPIQRMPISECLNLINVCLDILARGLVMSPHELGQSDSHEVTAQEVLTRAGSVSTRLQYTASGVDDFIYAWQRQLHDAGLAYWDDQVFAEVALQNDTDKKVLEQMGFKIESENDEQRKAGVSGSKTKLEIDMYTARRDAPDRVNSVAMATAMTNFFQAFINNPMAIQIIGIDQFTELVNGILDSFQFRKDWRLTAKTDPFKEQKEMAEKQAQDQKDMAQAQSVQAVTQQLQQLIPEIQKQTIAEVGAQLKPVFDQAAQLDATQQQQLQQHEAIMGKMLEIMGLLPPGVHSQMAPPAAAQAPMGMAPARMGMEPAMAPMA